MTILLAATTVILLVLGFLVMRHLDEFIERGGILDSPQGRANQGILIYGAPEVEEKIHKIGMKCKILIDPIFPEDSLYSALVALSHDDCANLALCHMARQADPGIIIIARCSTPNLQSIFEAMGVSRLLSVEESVVPLLAELGGVGR
ncbi:NAD-binding protein [Oscillibacter sp.]|uniref:NAD-binding protein n=1 Tax=Oscillibacter sp. TaxID=1945593 RepID=UPI0028A04812|nr:NAD-binding protein [Oscillibacter sp.]